MKVIFSILILICCSVGFAQSVDDGDIRATLSSTPELTQWYGQFQLLEQKIKNNEFNTVDEVIYVLKDLTAANNKIWSTFTSFENNVVWNDRWPNPDFENQSRLGLTVVRLRWSVVMQWVSQAPGYEQFWRLVRKMSASEQSINGSRNNEIYDEVAKLGYIHNLREQLILLEDLHISGLEISHGALDFRTEIESYGEFFALYESSDSLARALLLEQAFQQKLIPSVKAFNRVVKMFADFSSIEDFYGIPSLNLKEKLSWLRRVTSNNLSEVERIAARDHLTAAKILDAVFYVFPNRDWVPVSIAGDGRPDSFPTIENALQGHYPALFSSRMKCANIFAR